MNFKKLIYSIVLATCFNLIEIAADYLIVNDYEVREDLIDKAREILDLKPSVKEIKLPYPKFKELVQLLEDYDNFFKAVENDVPVALTREKLKEILNKII